ncbi:Uncharacterised protein [Candidatus Anstonella stagnisolia]|nr:Uncharacterised protein [Candidatus Anstonella stagnisolia]
MMQNTIQQRKLFQGEIGGNGKPTSAFGGRGLLDGPFSRSVFVRGERLAHTEMGEGYLKECWNRADSLAGVNGEMVLVAVSKKEIGMVGLWNVPLRFLERDLEDKDFIVTSGASEKIEGKQFFALVPKETAAQLASKSLPAERAEIL